eukprot:1177767-Prorocentrum_minimum.AAC.2
MADQQVFGLPRLAGRLTADLIIRSPQEMNAIKEYQIDLRGTNPSLLPHRRSTKCGGSCLSVWPIVDA